MSASDTHFLEQLSLTSQVLGALAFLAVLLWLFGRFGIPAVRAAEDARNSLLRESEGRLRKSRADEQRARLELERSEAEATLIRERAKEEAHHEHERIITEAKSNGERMIRNAEGELERARAVARVQLRSELLERALHIARERALTAVDSGMDARLVLHVVDRLERKGS
ncbi:MAG TPA: ATP synthase F0 subunit B [Candidatus Baltobacteraceae bacterium]|jgi:F-type H+-transporting ATPase subunit b|nr:ATP synthase F0 subunit B [Candidatus Baltobacteraceae bacterium]